MDIYTIGYDQITAEEFVQTLKAAPVRRLLDVRLNPTPHNADWARRDGLTLLLNESCAMDYHHVPALAPTKQMVTEFLERGGPWQIYEESFAALMKQRSVETVTEKALFDNAVLLCLEREPERCHRRLVAEYLQHYWTNVNIHHLIV